MQPWCLLQAIVGSDVPFTILDDEDLEPHVAIIKDQEDGGAGKCRCPFLLKRVTSVLAGHHSHPSCQQSLALLGAMALSRSGQGVETYRCSTSSRDRWLYCYGCSSLEIEVAWLSKVALS